MSSTTEASSDGFGVIPPALQRTTVSFLKSPLVLGYLAVGFLAVLMGARPVGLVLVSALFTLFAYPVLAAVLTLWRRLRR